jgi:hypothetical protein
MLLRALLLLALGMFAGVSTMEPNRKKIFLMAGQSNTEGNVDLKGLRRLASALPAGATSKTLTTAQRTQLRIAVANSQGHMCFEWSKGFPACKSGQVSECASALLEAADVVIDELIDMPLAWDTLFIDGYKHPSVAIHASQFRYKEVTLQMKKSGQMRRPMINCNCRTEECGVYRGETVINGPELSRYTSASTASLGPGFLESTVPLGPGFGTNYHYDRPLRPQTEVTFGPELAFGQVIGETFPNSMIVKVAMGGSSLGDHWRVNGTLFNALVQDAASALAAAGDGSEIVGFVWFQGYNDQYPGVYCNEQHKEYEENLKALIGAIRGQLNLPSLPVLLVKPRNGGKLPIIQVAQDNVASDVSFVGTIESKDLSTCFHYDAGAQIVIGKRAADAMVSLMLSDAIDDGDDGDAGDDASSDDN